MQPLPPTPCSDARTVFLVNQISRHGHLDLYARLYSACLLELGYRVVLIAQHESGVREWLVAKCGDRIDDFIFLARSELEVAPPCVAEVITEPIPPLLSRLRRVWRKEGGRGLALRMYLHGRKYYHWSRRPLDVAGAFLRRFLAPSGISFVSVVEELGIAERRLGVRPALVFFLYLDMMIDDRKGCRYLARHLAAPWAGILFHPRKFRGHHGVRPERYFGRGNARGAAFLDPDCVRRYAKIFPALRFGALPDVTDASTLPGDSLLVTRLRELAGDRTVVLLVGSLTPDKGVMQFINVIRRADPGRFFFAIVGEVFWESFGRQEQELRRFAENPPENCLVRPGYIEDEREFNAVIAASDILYAVYPDVSGSSNTMTKAATFQRPVIVSDRYLMGERVSRYDIGAAVKSGDIDQIIAALELLRQRNRDEFGFAAYRRDHSIDALKAELAKLLERWLPARQPAG